MTSPLAAAVTRAVGAAQTALDLVPATGTARQVSLRSQLVIQLAGLRQLESAAATDRVARRIWSLGQASVPIVPVLVGSLRAAGCAIPAELGREVDAAFGALATALQDHAEGR